MSRHSFGLSRQGTYKVRDDRTGGHRQLAHGRRALPDTGRCRVLAGASPARECVVMVRGTGTCADACASRSACIVPIDALLHNGLTGPMTCGVLKPAIILPASAQQWDEAALRCALRHELEHVARWDFLTHCLSRMICAAYWFHPLVWAAWRRLRLEAERACDDAVLRQDDARDYASLLVAIAQRERGRQATARVSRWRVVTISRHVSRRCWMTTRHVVVLDVAGQPG